MSVPYAAASAFALLLLAGCAAESKAPPVSTAGGQMGPSSQSPQSPNSLPRGSAVNAPFDAQTGVVGVTRVGPQR